MKIKHITIDTGMSEELPENAKCLWASLDARGKAHLIIQLDEKEE